MSADLTPYEQRLLGLCRRLLRQNEDLHRHNQDLHAHTDRLCGQLRWLGREYRTLQAKLDQTERDHAVQEQAAEVFIGAALDGLRRNAPGGGR
jgi:hypothetical protein